VVCGPAHITDPARGIINRKRVLNFVGGRSADEQKKRERCNWDFHWTLLRFDDFCILKIPVCRYISLIFGSEINDC
jgi:hypothetical protein